MSEQYEASPSRAYRWALKAFPTSYLAEHGDDLTGVLTEAHAGESHPSIAECTSLITSGLKRRSAAMRADTAGAVIATAIGLEALFCIFLAGLAIHFATTALSPQVLAPALFERLVRHQDLLRLSLFVALELVLAVVFGAASGLAWRRVGDKGALTRTRLELATMAVQPMVLFMVGTAIASFVDVDPLQSLTAPDAAFKAAALMVTGLVIGILLLRLSHLRGWWSAGRFGGVAALAVAVTALSVFAFAVAGVQLGGRVTNLHTGSGVVPFFAPLVPVGSGTSGNMGNGFSELVAEPTGLVMPVATDCDRNGQCSILAVSSLESRAGGALFQSTGGKWSVGLGLPANYLQGTLTCPSGGTSYVIGNGPIYKTTDGGQSWVKLHTPVLGETPSFGTALTCTSAVRCMLGTPAGIYLTNDGGQSWRRTVTFLPALTTQRLQRAVLGISCPGIDTCYGAALTTRLPGNGTIIIRTDLVATTNGGRSWVTIPVKQLSYTTSRELPPPGADSLTCVSVGHCIYVGTLTGKTVELATNNGGTVWRQLPLPAALSANAEESETTCMSDDVCWLVPGTPGSVWRSSDGGLSWHQELLPPGVALGSSLYMGGTPSLQYAHGPLSCSDGKSCLGIGQRVGARSARSANVVLSTSDGGSHWVIRDAPVLSPRNRPRATVVG